MLWREVLLMDQRREFILLFQQAGFAKPIAVPTRRRPRHCPDAAGGAGCLRALSRVSLAEPPPTRLAFGQPPKSELRSSRPHHARSGARGEGLRPASVALSRTRRLRFSSKFEHGDAVGGIVAASRFF